MKPLKWNDAYASGDLTVDTQHMVLFEILNRIRSTISSGNKEVETRPLIEFLQRYVIEHFECEERLMVAKGYPHISSHRSAHESISQTVQTVVENFNKNPASFTSETCVTMAKILEQHISEEDLKMITFVRTT